MVWAFTVYYPLYFSPFFNYIFGVFSLVSAVKNSRFSKCCKIVLQHHLQPKGSEFFCLHWALFHSFCFTKIYTFISLNAGSPSYIDTIWIQNCLSLPSAFCQGCSALSFFGVAFIKLAMKHQKQLLSKNPDFFHYLLLPYPNFWHSPSIYTKMTFSWKTRSQRTFI